MSRSHVYFVKGVKPSFTKYTLLHSDGFESLQCEKNTDTQMGIRVFWQRMRDSNPRKRSQSPVCYRYTNPLFFVTESHMVETTGLEPVTSCV